MNAKPETAWFSEKRKIFDPLPKPDGNTFAQGSFERARIESGAARTAWLFVSNHVLRRFAF